ncbi:MAG: type II secretion system F family protein [Thermoguttaceae bacterium]|nr:type II secretion system F family protein [Thermoguttaceae bacterium]MDW8039264.1 type II secretion system F family protein [Thermoguttaceae bacterium]
MSIFAVDLLFRNFEDLLPVALFGLFTVGAWWLLEQLAGGRTRTLERLQEIKTPRKPSSQNLLKEDPVRKVLEKTAVLAKPLEPKTQEELTRLKAKLSYAGFRGEHASRIFLAFKFAGLLVGLLLGGGVSLFSYGLQQKGLITTIAIAGGLFYLPDLAVWYLARRRQQEIFLGLPDALDLMVVCVEAGLGLDQAMRKVAEEMKDVYPVVAEEFALANFQLQMGRPRAEVLHELGARTGVADLRSLAGVLIQADKFGSSVAQALRVQSDSMRTRRRQLAEEKAAKTAVKLIFPLVLFIFPGIFVVLVGPAAISMMREMFPKMAGG